MVTTAACGAPQLVCCYNGHTVHDLEMLIMLQNVLPTSSYSHRSHHCRRACRSSNRGHNHRLLSGYPPRCSFPSLKKLAQVVKRRCTLCNMATLANVAAVMFEQVRVTPTPSLGIFSHRRFRRSSQQPVCVEQRLHMITIIIMTITTPTTIIVVIIMAITIITNAPHRHHTRAS